MQLDSAFDNRAARTARALQLLTEIFQELGILRQSVDNGDGLAPASFLFHPQLRDDARRDRIVGCCVPGAALAVPLRPAADGTLAGGCSGVHETRVVLESHHL